MAAITPVPAPTGIVLDNLFRSARLVYRAAENTPEDKAFNRTILEDAATYAQGTNRMLKPLAPDVHDKEYEGMLKALLCVVACLPPPPAGEADGEGVEKKGPTPIGIITLDSSVVVMHHRSINLSVCLALEHQGHGLGTEAINWALDWAFRVAGMHCVRLAAFSFNTRAVKLYERLGFVKEGVRRDSIYFDRQWHHHIMFSMLENEWAVLRGQS